MGNPDKKHYSSGSPVGYKVMSGNFVPLLVKDDSLVARRAPFAKHHMWTVPYTDDRLYPAGKFPTQTKQAPEDSLEGWAARDDNISHTDSESRSLLVVGFGRRRADAARSQSSRSLRSASRTSHARKTGPSCRMKRRASCSRSVSTAHLPTREAPDLTLLAPQPSSFFKANPSLDVPSSVDAKSVHALGGGNTPMSEAKTEGKTCCGGSKL